MWKQDIQRKKRREKCINKEERKKDKVKGERGKGGQREKVVMSQGSCTTNRAEFTHFERLIHHHSDNCLRAYAATCFLYLLQCYAKQSR